jgi:hypothetical protein
MKHKFNSENNLHQMLECKGSMEWGKRKDYEQMGHEQRTFQYAMCHHSTEKPQVCAQFCLSSPTPEVNNCFLDKLTAVHDNNEFVRYSV